MRNKVSIIVPFYNIQEQYMSDCMNSLLSQTYKNIEILIVDDGSKEEYSKQLDKYAGIDGVKILYKNNGGVASARNMGMAYMTGDWCMFVDSDDWLEESCVEDLVRAAQQGNNPDYIVSKANLVSGSKTAENKNTLTESQHLDRDAVVRDIVVNKNPDLTCIETVWAKLYNVKFLRKNDLMYDASLRSGEDVPFSLDCTLNSDNIYYLDKATYNYRYNDFSECRTCKGLDTKSTKMLAKIKQVLDKHGKQESGYYDYYVMRVISRLMRKFYNGYESESEFVQDFGDLISMPEYRSVLDNPNEKLFEEGKVQLARLCKDGKLEELFSMMQDNQIAK